DLPTVADEAIRVRVPVVIPNWHGRGVCKDIAPKRALARNSRSRVDCADYFYEDALPSGCLLETSDQREIRKGGRVRFPSRQRWSRRRGGTRARCLRVAATAGAADGAEK